MFFLKWLKEAELSLSEPSKRAMIGRLENQAELLERHVDVLNAVIEDEPIGIMALANRTGIAPHRIRYSRRKLEEELIIEPSDKGAKLTTESSDILSGQDARLDTIIEILEGLQPIIREFSRVQS